MISRGLTERVGIRQAIRLCANGVGYRRGKMGGDSRVVGNSYLGITSGLPVIRPKPAVSPRIGYYIVRTARNRVVPSTTR